MVYRGHVKNGVVVLDEAVPLPEGAKVTVELVERGEEDLHPEIAKFSGILPANLDVKEAYIHGLMGKHQ